MTAALWQPALLSLKVALWATAIDLVLGVAAGYALARWRSRLAALADALEEAQALLVRRLGAVTLADLAREFDQICHTAAWGLADHPQS